MASFATSSKKLDRDLKEKTFDDTTDARPATRDSNPDSIEVVESADDGRTTTQHPIDDNGTDHHHHVYKVYRRRWFGVVVLVLLNVVASWNWLTFAPVPGSTARYLGVDESSVNWFSISFLLVFAAATPLVMYMLHLGPKPAIMLSAALVLVGNWVRYAGVVADGGNFGVVMFGQVICGLSQPLVLAAPTRYSDLWFTRNGRVAATALMTLANPFGAALGQLIVPFWVADYRDIPNMVLYVSIISTICAVPAFFIPAAPPTPAAHSSETPKTEILPGLRVLVRMPEFWMLVLPFAVYVGFFNSLSSLLNQVLVPYGYSDDEAGIAGAVLIVVGLVAAAAASPVIDRTKAFLRAVKIFVPLIAASYVAFIWMPETRAEGGVAGPYVVLAILGASSFSLLPVAVELLVEVTYPVSPEVTSTIAWSCGQLLGAVFIIVSDQLKDGAAASPPWNLKNALIFQAVLTGVAVIPAMCLGMFGREDKVALKRCMSDMRAEAEENELRVQQGGVTISV